MPGLAHLRRGQHITACTQAPLLLLSQLKASPPISFSIINRLSDRILDAHALGPRVFSQGIENSISYTPSPASPSLLCQHCQRQLSPGSVFLTHPRAPHIHLFLIPSPLPTQWPWPGSAAMQLDGESSALTLNTAHFSLLIEYGS